MSDDPWLISLGAGRWQMPGIRAARAAGLRVLAIDGQDDAPGLAISDRAMIVDICDAPAVISAIAAAGGILQPSGAISFCNEAGMMTAAAIREYFRLPGAGSKVVQALTNKGIQRASWSRANLPCPTWAVVKTAEEVPAVIASIGDTAIFKPVDSAGSRGITVVANGAPWEEAFERAWNGSRSREVVIERFIVGQEYTVETFTHAGVTHVLAVTSKKKVTGTSDTVAYELASVDLSPEKRAEIEDVCARALAALGYENGPGHTELLITDDDQIFLVESAGRGGGFMVADGVVPGVSGFDLATACAVQAVGLAPAIPANAPRRAAVLRFVPSKRGTVVRIRGFEANDEVSGVQSEPLVVIGQKMGSAQSDGDRMAFILAVADDRAEALRLADEREARIGIDVE